MATSIAPGEIKSGEKKVIFASALGTVFEWYDFYLYGSMAALISKHFFSGVNDTTAFIFALLAFAAGFAVRPFGALVFGRLGDLIGRKYTFLVTIVIMGLATAIVGILPTYASIGIAAPIILVVLRLLQGLALGGEYGGAATYVAEHAPTGKRGAYTSWIQTTATLGLFLSLLVISLCRNVLGKEVFEAWGWRLPFLLSILLLAISLYIRLQLNESPIFLRMKAQGLRSKAPLKEAFGRWSNLKLVLLSLFGATAGQAVVWYTGQFYVLFFLTKTLGVDANRADLMIASALLIATPFFVIFGTLSDHIGRKKIIIAGCLLAAFTYVPIFKALTHYANPALEHAVANAPVVVTADHNACSFQFDPIGKASFTSSCDLIKNILAKKGIPYSNQDAPAGTVAHVSIGEQNIASFEGHNLAKENFTAQNAELAQQLTSALTAAGYPNSADPHQMNTVVVIILLSILVIYVTMVYGPIAALLVELFPTRIRYTSMSLPYHVGNGWFGGFLPTIAFAMVAATGDIYFGLWYPIAIALFTAIIGALLVPETYQRDLDDDVA